MIFIDNQYENPDTLELCHRIFLKPFPQAQPLGAAIKSTYGEPARPILQWAASDPRGSCGRPGSGQRSTARARSNSCTHRTSGCESNSWSRRQGCTHPSSRRMCEKVQIGTYMEKTVQWIQSGQITIEWMDQVLIERYIYSY